MIEDGNADASDAAGRDASQRGVAPEDPPPMVLDYSVGAPPPRTSRPAQFAAGFLSYVMAASVMLFASFRMGGDIALFMCGYVLVLAAVFVPGAMLQRRYGWTAFLPGALTGVGVTCLITPFSFLATCRI